MIADLEARVVATWAAAEADPAAALDVEAIEATIDALGPR